MTHTGALTGSEALHDALFERLGVARCEDLSTLVETLKLLHVQDLFLIGRFSGCIRRRYRDDGRSFKRA